MHYIRELLDNMKQKFTVTIGIPAHNEEKNIANLLDSILLQENKFHKLEKIIVACDACSDNTEQIVREYSKKDKRIEVINDGRRLGQARRLEKFYGINKSEIFVTFDGDTVLATRQTLDELVKPFENPEIGLVGGNDTPCTPRTFVEKIAAAKINFWYQVRKDVNGGDSVHNHHGPISAIRREPSLNAHYPENESANDNSLYFLVKQQGYKMAFAKKAVAYFKTVDNLNDFLVQFARFGSHKKIIKKGFGDWTVAYYKVPLKNKISGLMESLFKDPIFTVLAVLSHFTVNIIEERYRKYQSNGLWKIADSSKDISFKLQ